MDASAHDGWKARRPAAHVMADRNSERRRDGGGGHTRARACSCSCSCSCSSVDGWLVAITVFERLESGPTEDEEAGIQEMEGCL